MAAQPTKAKAPTCPRCEGRMPKGRSALSRADNRTIICSKCGREEGMIVFHGGTLPTTAEWPLNYSFA